MTKLFKALRDDEEYDILYLFTIMLCTGVRYSEANAIHLEQINFDNQTIYIDRQWDRNEREFILPKNGEKRMVTYNRQLAHTLLEVLERRPAMLEAYEVDTDLLIFNDKGGPLDISIANNRLHTYEPQDKSYTTHIFRHTYVTRMVENYVPGKLIAKQVGHADTGLIDKIYGHFSQKMDNDLKQAVSKVTF